MSWAQHQQYRLAVEQRILREHMPDFTFRDPAGDTAVVGKWTTSAGNTYHIVITVPPGFPDECPGCYVERPSPMADHAGRPLEDYRSDHNMHLWETDRPGWTKLCTYRPESWSAAHSIEKVLQKAMLWLEAYEGHKTTGRPINHFLLDMN